MDITGGYKTALPQGSSQDRVAGIAKGTNGQSLGYEILAWNPDSNSLGVILDELLNLQPQFPYLSKAGWRLKIV